MSVLDRALRGSGGRWAPPEGSALANLEQTIVRRIRRIQIANYDNGFLPIEFGFVDDGSFNAFATKYEDTDIIGMNVGLLLILNNLFFAMLSHPEILPAIGQSSAESAKNYEPGTWTVNIFE